MPKGDGSGPPGGKGQRAARLQGNRPGAGPGGYCVCPRCGEKLPHQQGTPCYTLICPKCNISMTRE